MLGNGGCVALPPSRPRVRVEEGVAEAVVETDKVGLIARGPGVGVTERSRSNLAMTVGDTARVRVGDLARAVALLVPDTEVGTTLEARHLPGAGVEGGGGRFIGVTDLAAGGDAGGDEEGI